MPPLSPKTGTSDRVIRDRLRMLMAIDDGVGRLFDVLQRTGCLDDTVIVFMSDHGYFYGEHFLEYQSRLAYEETLRIPLLIRYPPLVKPKSTTSFAALSIDLMPTLLELAEVAAPGNLHGRSLVPLLRGETMKPRKSFLIEYYSDTVWPRIWSMGYQAVRSDRWKYIRYVELEGMDELYDLHADPYEMQNLAAAPDASEPLREMRRELWRLLEETGGERR
jgi:N-acetylglucosamine-6-sulfatase